MECYNSVLRVVTDKGLLVNIRFADLVDLKKLGDLMSAFYALTGIPSSLMDLDGNLLRTDEGEPLGVGWQPLCLDFHRRHPVTARNCRTSDVEIFLSLKQVGRAVCWTCPNGLVDAAVPVIIEGEHLVNLFTGQFFLEPPDLDAFRRRAREFGFDEERYLAAIEQVPVLPRERVDRALEFLNTLAGVVAEMGLTQKRLRAAEARLADALDSIDEGFNLFDANERLVAWNRRCVELFPSLTGRHRPGASFDELMTALVDGEMPAPLREEHLAARRRHRRQPGQPFERQLADGRWIETVDRPTGDGGMVSVHRDITRRKSADEALRRELAFKQVLIDAIPFPVFAVDAHSRLTARNRAFDTAFGAVDDSPADHWPTGGFPADACEIQGQCRLHLARGGGEAKFETVLPFVKRGLRRVLVVLATFTDDDVGRAGLIGTLIDVTDQRHTEEQLAQSGKLAALGQISSEVAHEISQPLFAMRLAIELAGLRLDGKRLEARDWRSTVDALAHHVEQMTEITEHLRSFSRWERHEQRPFAPAEVIRTAVKLMRPQFRLDGIALDFPAPAYGGEVLGHPNRFEQVVLNLLGNARDAVRARRNAEPGLCGRVVITVGEPDAAGMVAVTVEDNGGGVPDDLWPKIFGSFFTTKPEGEGTGLGLSIASRIVAAMNGQIRGRNAGEGACFEVQLPVLATK